MKLRSSMLLLTVLASFAVFAQDKQPTDKIRFSSQNYLGFLEGESGMAFQAQTVNGIRYKTWFTGIGTGIDHYFERSVPFFLSVGKFLPSKKIPLYVHADGGINFPWVSDRSHNSPGWGEYSNAFYWAGGLGYKFSFKNQGFSMLLNAGYSFKHMIQRGELWMPCLVGPCPVEEERFDYRLKRVSVKLGIVF